MTHHTHDNALKSLAIAITSASKRQKAVVVKSRFKYQSRLDEYVDYTAKRFDAVVEKKTPKRRLEVVRNRDNKHEYLPEYEVYETTGRGKKKISEVIERFDTYELADEYISSLISA